MHTVIPCACGDVEMREDEWKKSLLVLTPKTGRIHFPGHCGYIVHNCDDPSDPQEIPNHLEVVYEP